MKGFNKVKWSDVVNGEEVFLQGISYVSGTGVFRPYGPFKVVSQKDRVLENAKGNKFMHYAEDLVLQIHDNKDDTIQVSGTKLLMLAIGLRAGQLTKDEAISELCSILEMGLDELTELAEK